MIELFEKIKVKLEDGFSLYDVVFEKEDSKDYLKVFVEKEDGIVSLDDCAKISNDISDICEKYINKEFILEVSSPGIERNIRTDEHLKRYLDNKICIRTKNNISGKKILEGILKEFNNEYILLDNIKIERSKIKKINLVYDFNFK